MTDNAESSGKPHWGPSPTLADYADLDEMCDCKELTKALEAAEARIEKLKRQIAHYELETETVKEVKAENAKLRDDMHALLSAIDEYQHDVLETRGRNPSRWLEQVIERIDRVLKVED